MEIIEIFRNHPVTIKFLWKDECFTLDNAIYNIDSIVITPYEIRFQSKTDIKCTFIFRFNKLIVDNNLAYPVNCIYVNNVCFTKGFDGERIKLPKFFKFLIKMGFVHKN